MILTPPIKYAGGKSWLVPRMLEMYAPHRHRRFVDPFCGSCALPLALKPEQVLVCDINAHLINFWNWVKTNAIFTIAMFNDELLYYQYRSLFNDSDDLITKAELFYFLNRSCYNGLTRFSKKGRFNTPFGRYKRINFRQDLLEYKEAIASWEVSSKDFPDTFKQNLKSDDFLYLDPPYHQTFVSYSRHGFTIDNQIYLADLASSRTAPVIVSNSATSEMVNLYSSRGFDIQLIEVPRRISCKDRPPAMEILATKNL